jgi:predicted RNA polymerase sigma factor
MQLTDFTSAASHLQKAIHLTEIESERQLLQSRLRECESRLSAA